MTSVAHFDLRKTLVRMIQSIDKVHMAMNAKALNNNTLSNNLHIHRVGHPACMH